MVGDTHHEVWHLETRRIGRRVLVFDRVDSTNTRAMALASEAANDGVAILANAQDAGRGQHGRSWVCPPGSGVLMSILLFPPPGVRRPAVLTAWAAVAVCKVIGRSIGVEAQIKWPNDILIQGRKVCGILIEQALATVVGIGLNVHQSAEELKQAGLTEAASLSNFGKRAEKAVRGQGSGASEESARASSSSLTPDPLPLTTSLAARLLIEQLDADYDRLRNGDFAELEACWKFQTGLLGKRVVAECSDGTYSGRLRNLTFQALELELPEGQFLALPPERVRHVRIS
jgi:BirA family biotin operon repressor/biotin-[acetyl-CoA-carboxylase] ligase